MPTVPHILLGTSLPDDRSFGWATGFVTPRMTVEHVPRTGGAVARVSGRVVRAWDDPLAALGWMSETFANDRGRWIGYLAYDLGRLFEPALTATGVAAIDDLHVPLFRFTYCGPRGDRSNLPTADHPRGSAPLTSTFTRDAYLHAVRRAIDYVSAGDVFQVNIAQRFTVGLAEDPLAIYQRLSRGYPAAYGAYLGYDDFAILCNSPELFLRVTGDRRVVTRPIKGTRPLAPGMDDELLASEKDAAELNMIVDLERNDLGRVCAVGSLRVTERRTVEPHPTVYHGVATVEGTLRDDVSFVDLLRATFPGGSITGAPKIRAAQIIDALEPVRRGPYCGAIGYVARGGVMQFNVAIRTMIVKDGLVHIPVGGGIVADSDPATEYDETLVKARAMFAAVGIDAPGVG